MQSSNPIDLIRDELRRRGLQATAARVAVLQVLTEGHEHTSVDEIRRKVLERYPTIDPVTVYRTLETLEAQGLAVRVVLGDKVTRWAHMTDLHHHMVCRACERIVELADEPFHKLAEDLAERYELRVEMQHLVLHGLCPSCARAEVTAISGEHAGEPS